MGWRQWDPLALLIDWLSAHREFKEKYAYLISQGVPPKEAKIRAKWHAGLKP